ncbi:phosphate ABC transporter substrate-binding protein PstS family protein [soil metagenome]
MAMRLSLRAHGVVMAVLVAFAATVGPTAAQVHAVRVAVDPALPACVPQPAAPRADAGFVAPDGTVRIAVADHARHIVERLNALYMRTHPGTRLRIEPLGAASAVPALMFDRTLFGTVGAGIDAIEAVPLRKIAGEAPLGIRIAHSAAQASGDVIASLAVYVHRSNPIERLSPQQVAQAFTLGHPQGDVSSWGQLGLPGQHGDWAMRPVHPVGAPEHTDAGDYLDRHHLQGRPFAVGYEALDSDAAVLRRVAEDPSAIAIAPIGLASAGVRQLAIVAPDGSLSTGTREEIADGRYPYARPIVFALRRTPGQPPDPMAIEYLRLVLSAEGQQIIASQPRGYVPLTAVQARAELARLR